MMAMHNTLYQPVKGVDMFTMLYADRVAKHLAVRITSPDGESTELALGPMISKRNKEELIPDVQYAVINEYLSYKGDVFKSSLFNNIVEAEMAVEETGFHKGISNPPIAAMHRILDMFDMVDIVNFMRNVSSVTPPENLLDSFNVQIEKDCLGTRTQTYIKQDYYELAALTIPIKAIIGVLGQYAIRKETSINVMHREYVLYLMISDHPLMQHPSVIKIREWAKILMDLGVTTSEMLSVTVIEKQIPLSELPDYLLGIVLMQKVSIAAIMPDTRERNIITRVYNYIINKLKTRGGSGTTIRDKRPLSDTDSACGDKESIIESYRMASNITAGTEAELNWYTNNIGYLVRDISFDVDMELLNDVLAMNQCFRTIPIAKEQVILASYIFKQILDPRALDYIGIDGIINIISIGVTILWNTGHRQLALVLGGKQVVENTNVVDINCVPDIRIDPELKSKLAVYFPYEKRLNATKTVSVIEQAITDLTYRIFSKKWIPNMPKQCLLEYYGDKTPRILPVKFKDLLTKLIIEIEEENERVASNECK